MNVVTNNDILPFESGECALGLVWSKFHGREGGGDERTFD